MQQVEWPTYDPAPQTDGVPPPMSDVEVFKLILNGGSFGLVVILVLWALFKASPALKDSIEKMNADHATAMEKITADHKTTMTAVAEAHKVTVATISAEFRTALTAATADHKAAMAAVSAECREERAELLRRYDEHVEKDREARHDTADKVQAALNNMAASLLKDRAAK